MRLIDTSPLSSVFFFSHTATTKIYTLSLHDALPISPVLSNQVQYSLVARKPDRELVPFAQANDTSSRSEEHTSELQSLRHLVCRLLLEKKKENDQPCRDTPSRHISPSLILCIDSGSR